ncbi:HupE/UreJ family protein [Curvibacter sp. APW13]|uniref:HupE/UreJ family protein n=1 Tax=Curvibacter sp. APW13 TaxID=3077236 RepID=UPI0028DE5570|nr:HupE/UreJ family protein [Curvibacter sp. APW13]MDT8989908.1 HupE/UreJ family protein [Curvibacter sp. APW13]
MVRIGAWVWLVVLLLVGMGTACAHESLPASLMLQERTPGVFDVQWRLPDTQGVVPEVRPVFPETCTMRSAPEQRPSPGARLALWQLACSAGLHGGERVHFAGLPLTLVDVLVRVDYADGTQWTAIAHPRAPEVALASRAALALAVSDYLLLGVEHILTGADHLLFVLCLVLLVRERLRLLQTITAFTLAHSLTLGLAALGWVRVPAAPVEACIALSILFLARELVLRQAGRPAGGTPHPAVVAFVFGLLHGLGFAGALSQVGLPAGDVPAALLLFNLGVELGQLLFVGLVLPLLALLRHASRHAPASWRAAPLWGLGGWAGFWWLQRMVPVLGL